MNSGLENKMYNFEVVPPAGLWQKIADELDDSGLSHEFPSTLYNVTVTPPSYLWQRIADGLDEPVLSDQYSAVLFGASVIPPAATWDKIAASLDAEDVAAPARRRFSPWPKYAAAAALLGFIAWTGVRLMDNKRAIKDLAKEELSQPRKSIVPLTDSLSTPNIPDESVVAINPVAATDEARNDAALEASKRTFAKLDISASGKRIRNAAHFYFPTDPYTTENTGIAAAITASGESAIDISRRYILLMTPDGNIIRMSKKLSDMVCCVSGAEQDENCKDQMKKWQEKIACSPVVHAPGNFMDILALANSLQDN